MRTPVSGKIPATSGHNKTRVENPPPEPGLIDFETAQTLIAAEITPLPVRALPAEPGSFVTAAPVRAVVDVPGFDNAAVDGFALAAADAAAGELPIGGTVTAGQPPPTEARPGIAWEIMTGAPLPPGCDGVIPVEQVEIMPGRRLRPGPTFTSGANVRRRGEDFRAGDLVLPAGRCIDPPARMALAATGCDEVPVRAAPRVGVLATGAELRTSGLPGPGGIRDANGPYLAGALAAAGCIGGVHRQVGDDAAAITAALAELATDCDVIITTGGVSAGRMDLVPAAIRAAGGTVLFHKVGIRPGKPILFARLATGPLIFALPGNPIAVAVGLRFFVLPALRALQGLPAEHFPLAICRDEIRPRGNLRFFGKARAFLDGEGRLAVQLLRGQESFRVAPLLEANCWLVIPENSAPRIGDRLPVAPLEPGRFSL